MHNLGFCRRAWLHRCLFLAACVCAPAVGKQQMLAAWLEAGSSAWQERQGAVFWGGWVGKTKLALVSMWPARPSVSV